MSIHQRIRSLRIAAGMSQVAFAAAVSALTPNEPPITRQTVQHWEREGGTAPRRSRLEHVAAALGTTVAALLSDESDRTTHTVTERFRQRDEVAPRLAAEPPASYLSLQAAVELAVSAIATLTPSAWAMARGALDTVVGHPELRDDVAANVLLVLRAASDKRLAAA